MLIPGGSDADAEPIAGRLRHHLEAAGIAASIGVAVRSVEGSLAGAVQKADERMYADKRRRRALAASP